MKKALVVGIDAYPGAPLNGCVNDANEMASILQTHSDGGPNFDVRKEVDIRTKGELKSKIRQLFEGDNDISLLYFSGHGFVNELGGYLVTPDYSKDDTGLSMSDIISLANESKVKEKVIILDCCHAGAMGQSNLSKKVSEIGQGLTVLSASRDTESAMEVMGHGVFTNLLIGALQGGAADLRGHVTPGSVYAYVDQALNAWDQRPVFKSNVHQFISLRKVTPPIALGDLRQMADIFIAPQETIDLDPSYEETSDEAVNAHVAVFKVLQRYESVGLVVPVDEEHMYWAAMNRRSCRLTALGAHYWNLVKNRRI